MENSFLMLNELVNKIPKIDGIVSFSLFQLPKEYNPRNDIYKNILMQMGVGIYNDEQSHSSTGGVPPRKLLEAT